MGQPLETLETPALLLDEARMERNIERMRRQVQRLGVAFRPHVKTNKCLEVSRRIMTTPQGPITVSTLLEADHFAAQGVQDILYAVCIAPNKMDHVLKLQAGGARMSVIVDSVEAARLVAQRLAQDGASRGAPSTVIPAQAGFQEGSRHAGDAPDGVGVLIEIDCDGHRSGVKPDAPELLEIARALAEYSVPVRGVMTHAGSSYDCRDAHALRAMAEQERACIVQAAQRLRASGFDCPVVSVGSTPTALFAEHLEGVTELRAGVYVFFDLVMAGIGVCSVDEIALSVLATVIGHQREKGWTLLDAGWMAMSRDRGTAGQPVDQGYGLVCDVAGRPLDDYILAGANQEHGIMARRPGAAPGALELQVGQQVRILPNHACSTAAQYNAYRVVGEDGTVTATWPRFSGW